MKNIRAVIGANYGDEGKGLMTDYFCHKAVSDGKSCVGVCTNGGAQRGHTVETEDNKRHIFSHFSSGTLCGAHTYLSPLYILNPMIFATEYSELERDGIKPYVLGDKNARWSSPFDMILNQIVEESRGDKKHGSCGIGIWETVYRYRKMRNIYSLKDFVRLSRADRLGVLKEYRGFMKQRLVEYQIDDFKKWNEIIESERLLMNFADDAEFLDENVIWTDTDVLNDYSEIVFENGQGLMLDGDSKNVHTTPSRTGMGDISEMLKSICGEYNLECCYVTRTYMTRHGAGPFETECGIAKINAEIRDLTNVYNAHQGHIRYGTIDADKLFERIAADYMGIKGKNTVLSAAVTHMNETDGKFAAQSADKFGEFIQKFDRMYFSDKKTRDGVRCKAVNPRAEK